MANIPFTHPKDFLRSEFQKRKSRNKSYSMRAFARDLSIAPSTLSEVLEGKYGFSKKTTLRTIKLLGLNEDEATQFKNLMIARFSKARGERRRAAQHGFTAKDPRFHSMSLDSFATIAKWYHLVLIEWITINGCAVADEPETYRRAAKALSIDEKKVLPALKRLERVGSLKHENGSWVINQVFMRTPNDIPCEAKTLFHEQMISKAAFALRTQPLEMREISTAIVSFPKEKIEEAKKMLRDFRLEFTLKFGSEFAPDSVYCLGLQFFALTKGEL